MTFDTMFYSQLKGLKTQGMTKRGGLQRKMLKFFK